MTRTMVIVIGHDVNDDGSDRIEILYANGANRVGEHFAQECAERFPMGVKGLSDFAGAVAWLEGFRPVKLSWMSICDDVVVIDVWPDGQVVVRALALVLDKSGTLEALDA